MGSLNRQSPRNQYYVSRKQVGKSLALNQTHGGVSYGPKVVDLQKITENSPHSNREKSPRYSSRIKFSLDVDQMNILKPEIAIEDNNLA